MWIRIKFIIFIFHNLCSTHSCQGMPGVLMVLFALSARKRCSKSWPVFSWATNSLNHSSKLSSQGLKASRHCSACFWCSTKRCNSLVVAPRLEMFFSRSIRAWDFANVPTNLSIILGYSGCSHQELWQLEDFDAGTATAMSVHKLTSICPQPEMVAVHSISSRRFSWHSRVRRALGQERALCPSLVLHGLREMSFVSQLSAIACISEFTLGFLHTVIGPGYARGLCETGNNLQPLSILWLPVPIQC